MLYELLIERSDYISSRGALAIARSRWPGKGSGPFLLPDGKAAKVCGGRVMGQDPLLGRGKD